MSLFDIFRKKKVERKSDRVTLRQSDSVTFKKTPVKKPVVKKKDIKMAFKVLESPHVTEKASDLTEKNKYSFKVSKRSNKTEIKKAIEELYEVSVVNVAIINIHRKKKRVGRTVGFKKGYKFPYTWYRSNHN